MTGLPRPCVVAVSNRQRLAPEARTPAAEMRALDAWVAELVAAGVDAIQVRERDVTAGLLSRLVSRCVARAQGTRTRMLVNDRADVALSAGADGVHLPSDGLPAGLVRSMWPRALIGRSVHGDDEAEHGASCDYVIHGTVFPSRSKPTAVPGGLEELRRSVARFACPVVAIGGVTPERVAAVVAAGAAGVAAIGAFLPPGAGPDALGPRQAVEAFREALRREMLQ